MDQAGRPGSPTSFPMGSRHEKSASTQLISQTPRKFERPAISRLDSRRSAWPDREMYIRCALKLKDVSSVADLCTDSQSSRV